ncbi:MAG: putative ABC transporter permease [Oscillospiraceae bacterium]|nr:putative ABC transporter permease [Oscillospiraceae bacterium]
MLKKASFIAAQFTLGGLAYCGIEVVYRGYTHRTMLVAGGICVVLLCLLARSQIGLIAGAVAGGLLITVVEFSIGTVANLWMGWEVWDYSFQPFNLWGQVCLGYTLAWCALGGLVILFARIIRGAVLLYVEREGKRRIGYR